MSTTQEFRLGQSRFDQTTFAGRYQHFLDILDPLTMIVGAAEVNRAREAIERYKLASAVERKAMNQEDLWAHQRVLQTATHPDTGAILHPLLRFSSFMPTNIFIATYMMLPSTVRSPVRSMGIHWFNQSYNCVVNFANRNASSDVSTADILGTYFVACGLSLSIALATAKAMERVPRGSMTAEIVRILGPYVAVSLAGSANVALMRKAEWLYAGVTVYDEEGGSHGQSLAAGRVGIKECAVTRWSWNLAVMIAPPIIMLPITRRGLSPLQTRVAEVAVIAMGLTFGVPAAIAIYPQREQVATVDLEPQFRNLKTKSGKPVESLFFNKGI